VNDLQPESRLSVAIVGSGSIAMTHMSIIVGHSGFELVALVDPTQAHADALMEAVSVQDPAAALPLHFSTLEEALAARRFDVIVITTPSGDHVDLAIAAAESGAHVLVEKPVDVSVVQAQRLLQVADRVKHRGQVVSVVSQHRFDPASRIVKNAIDDGAFGKLTSAVASVAWWRTQDYYDSGDWRGTWELDGGGAVMNQGVHTVDLLLWMFGRPTEISAETALLAHNRVEVEDVAVATIRFESGALATLHATTAAFPGLSVRLQVHGSRGSAVIDDDQLEYFAALESDDDDLTGGDRVANRASELVSGEHLGGQPKAPGWFPRAHGRQYDDFFEAITESRDPGVSVSDAVLSLAAVRSIYLAATLGIKITFDDVLSGKYDAVATRVGGAIAVEA
jgi:UDP-N-acetyl-2-amino-2-deoxyglucuronate dehydrogenase